MTAAVARVSTRLVRAPLERPWGPSVRSLSFVAVEVEDADGVAGHGFSWTPTIGARAVQALLDDDIRAFALGRPSDPRALWPHLWAHLHEAGGGGITTIAMAGLDLALWDLRCRREGASLVDVLGRRRDVVTAYGSGVNLHYPMAELTAQAERWVDDGFTAVKVKVGSPRLDDDIARVRAVREVIGPSRRLMIDANQRWDLPTAMRALDALADFGLDWVEEPLRADDLAGYRALHSSTDVPIALGENVHTIYRFEEFLGEGAVDVVQPNVVRVGGITPFLDIAGRVASTGARLAPHLLPELSGQLAMTLDEPAVVEVVEGAGMSELGLLTDAGPLSFSRGTLRDRPHVGLGLILDAATTPTRESSNAR